MLCSLMELSKSCLNKSKGNYIFYYRKQYTYGINIHENKELKVPTMEQVISSRIGSRNLWDVITQF